MRMVTGVGANITAWRKRRDLSQEQVANEANMSQGYLSRIETGRATVDRLSTIGAIAKALHASVPDLWGLPYAPHATDPELRDRATSAVATVRTALIELRIGRRRSGDVAPLDRVEVQVDELARLRMAADYAGTVERAGPAILAAAANGPDGDPHLVRALFDAAEALLTMGYVDLAREAASTALDVARRYEAPALIGLATYAMVHAIGAENADLGVPTLEATAGELERDLRDPDVRSMYGMLHLLASYLAAATSTPRVARAHLAEAGRVAVDAAEVSGGGFGRLWFCGTNVHLWDAAVSAQLRDTSAAVAAIEKIDMRAVVYHNRAVHGYLDLAAAYAATDDDDHVGVDDALALAALVAAEQRAPQQVAYSAQAAHLLSVLYRRAHDRVFTPDALAMMKRQGLLIT